jgi:PAS domain S-box-containing protein
MEPLETPAGAARGVTSRPWMSPLQYSRFVPAPERGQFGRPRSRMTRMAPPFGPVRRLPPVPESAREARRFVSEALVGLDADVVATVELLTSELVTNAVLHAATELEVRVWASDDRVHVSVLDGRAERPVYRGETDTDAATGRGLGLVEALASDFGVDNSESAKTVWFEVWPGLESAAPHGHWPAFESASLTEVALLEVPVGLCRAAKRHRAALLREARLALMSTRGNLRVAAEELQIAAGLNNLIDRSLEVSLAAAAPGSPTSSLVLAVPSDCGPAANTLASVLDRLDQAAAAGLLLTRPALPEIRRFRSWLLQEVTGQLERRTPSRWSGASADLDQASQLRLISGELFTDLDSLPGAAVAADDYNRIIGVNSRAASLLGWEPDSLVGQRITVLIPPEYRERHIAGFTTFLLTGQSRIIGTPVRMSALTGQGEALPVELRISVQHSQSGGTVFIAELTP